MLPNRRHVILVSAGSIAGVACFATNSHATEVRYNRPQETVDYQTRPRGKAACANCKLVRPDGCLVVASPIVPNGSCVLHEVK
jgi:hypothetical protein